MGLFSSRGPKLPSFVDLPLSGLRSHPVWQEAAARAGIDLANSQLLWRIDEATVMEGGLPRTGAPALLMGNGSRIAIAIPSEREISVLTRDTSVADLQTQRSGRFQIMFGPMQRMDVWMLGDLRVDTEEGRLFGNTVLSFLQGGLPRDASASSDSILSSGASPDSWSPPETTAALMAEARAFMEGWTSIVGQASDAVFWDALERFGRLGGAAQGPDLDHQGVAVGEVLERPWRTWAEISQQAIEMRDYELSARIFFFAWAVVNQVSFDVDTARRCGYVEPSDEIYRVIAERARTAVSRAPDDFSVVERTVQAPVTKDGLLQGLEHLLGDGPLAIGGN